MRKALVLSFAVHAAIFGVARPLVLRPAAAAPAPLAPPDDRWTGTTAELPGAGATAGAVYDVSVDPPAAPPAPIPAPVEAPVPVTTGETPVPPAPPVVVRAPDAPPAPVPVAVAPAPPRPRPAAASSVSVPAPPRKPRPRPETAASDRGAGASTSSGPSSGGGSGGAFGSEGAASVRDLGRAFTRAIPPASDSDPAWAQVSLGDAGKLEVAVHVDDTGHITSAEPRGESQPRALVSLVRRTIPLLQAGTFAVREGGVGEGTQILELRAIVSEVPVSADDPAPIGRGGLSFEYARGRGKAAFTQATGRHVEVTVKVLRVEGR